MNLNLGSVSEEGSLNSFHGHVKFSQKMLDINPFEEKNLYKLIIISFLKAQEFTSLGRPV